MATARADAGRPRCWPCVGARPDARRTSSAVQEVLVATGALAELEVGRSTTSPPQALAAIDVADITDDARKALAEMAHYVAWRERDRRGCRAADAVKVVVVGAGLGGLSAAAHLVGRGHDVTIVERSGAGRAGAGCGRRRGRVPARHRPDGADHARAAGRHVRGGGRRHGRLRHHPAGRPHVPGRVRGRQRAAGLARPGADEGRDRAPSPVRPTPRGSTGSARGSSGSTTSRWRASSTPTTTPCSTSPGRWRPRSASCGWAPSAGCPSVVGSYFRDERLRRIFSFQSMYAGLAPYEALALYAVITYMDAVEGVVVPEGGMHRMASGLAAAAREGGGRDPLPRTGHPHPARPGRRGDGRRARGGGRGRRRG